MKKIIRILLVLILIGGAFLMSACGEKNRYWETTYTNVSSFVEKQENSFLFGEVANLNYSEGIQTQIDNEIEEYKELENYYSILNNLMLMFNTHKPNLNIQPIVKDKQSTKLFESFDKQIQDMQNAINVFLAKKLYFEQHAIVNFNQSAALQELKNYKRHFSAIIYQALTFNQSFENLYTHAYLSFPTQNQTIYQTGLENLIATITTNRLIQSFVVYAFDDSDGTMADGINTNAINKIIQIQTALASPVYKENKLEIINEVIDYSLAFNVEINQYYQALEIVNMSNVRENGTESYLQQNPSHESYLIKIDEFNSTIINLHTNKVLELIA